MSEKNALGANRKEEYRKVAELFLRCQDVEEAHKMSAMVFGMECPQHLAGDLIRETDSMNIGVYEEQPMEITLKPRVRTYRENPEEVPSMNRQNRSRKQDVKCLRSRKKRRKNCGRWKWMERYILINYRYWNQESGDSSEMAVGCHGIGRLFSKDG